MELERSALRKIFRWGLVLRSAAGLLALAAGLYFDLPLIEDALHYESMGYDLARDWLFGESTEWFSVISYEGRTGWVMVVMIAIFYVLTGGIRLLPLLLVLYSMITALIPLYTYWITLELRAPREVARRAAWIVALMPTFVFWSGSLYKEGLIFLVLNMITYHTLRLQAAWTFRSVVLLPALLFALLGLRFYLAAIVGVVVAASLVLGHSQARTTGFTGPMAFVRRLVVTAAFIAVMVAFGFVERAERPIFETSQGVLVQLDASRQDLSQTYSGYLSDRVETFGDAARVFPAGLVYFLTVPHPWQIGSLRQNAVIPETVFWVVVLYPMVLLGMKRGLRVNFAGTLFIIMATAGMCAVYALLATNVGVAFRMRTQIWLLWVPFAAWGLHIWRERRRAARQGLAPSASAAMAR